MKAWISTAIVVLFISGCATLIPERHNANLLMGKNISEAYGVFGTPEAIMEDTMEGPHKGEKIYMWRKSRGSYSQNRLVGSDFEHGDNGRPTIVNTYQKQTFAVACATSLWVNDKGVVDYYEIHGDCGVGGIGLGNTGALHDVGIN